MCAYLGLPILCACLSVCVCCFETVILCRIQLMSLMSMIAFVLISHISHESHVDYITHGTDTTRVAFFCPCVCVIGGVCNYFCVTAFVCARV